MMWNPNLFHVNIILCTSQLVHCYVEPKYRQAAFYGTFVYAFNDAGSRKELYIEGPSSDSGGAEGLGLDGGF